MFTYVDNDGFYEYMVETDSLVKIASSVIASCVHNHRVDYSVDPDREFVPSNYLVSPFNSTDKFISGEYFLTTAQQKSKKKLHVNYKPTLSCTFQFLLMPAPVKR